jgi:Xaa-Pro dipeptidase
MVKSIANHDLPKPPAGKYPAKAHCRRVAAWIAENGGPSSGVIYLQGQTLKEHEVEVPMRMTRMRAAVLTVVAGR